jgi:DNA-binding XRE family transcriptional regulator
VDRSSKEEIVTHTEPGKGVRVDPKETLGQAIRRFREAAGMTPSELAARTDLNERCLLEIESDRYEPSEEALSSLVAALQDVGADLALVRDLSPSRTVVEKQEETYRRGRPSQYASIGGTVGMVIGAVGGSLYNVSDLNPNRGSVLNLATQLILLGPIVVGTAIGYVIGKLRG